jgi:glycosyltransferase involved in cell wall biosynthesis
MNKFITICYLGIYPPTAPRDRVYFDGLKKEGIQIIECVDNSAGLAKFWKLWKKLRAMENQYDILWVGYLSGMLVPLAWLATRKKILWNALGSWYESTVLDRGSHSRFSLIALCIWCADFLSFRLADAVLVESESQKRFLIRNFFVPASRLHVTFTGAIEEVFHPDPSIEKNKRFTVVFRGMFLPATGVEYVIEAAKILRQEEIDFVIIGWGQPLQGKIEQRIREENLSNIKLISVFLDPETLRKTMLQAHVMLGQFGAHARLERTIQNKTVEAMALGMPYITRDSKSNRELLTPNENCIFVPPADPQMIMQAILNLREDITLQQKLARNARFLYEKRLKDVVLGRQVLAVIQNSL